METDAALLCPRCGYDVRGTTGDACPECGGAVDRKALAKPQIPWVQRDRYTWLGRFFRTGWWVMNRPGRACAEVARHVDLAAGQRFRQLVIAWLCVPVALVGWHVVVDLDPRWSLEWHALATAVVVLLAWLGLQLVTGLHTYALHPARASVTQQNRAVALGHYACGPLVFLPPLLLGVYAAHVLRQTMGTLAQAFNPPPEWVLWLEWCGLVGMAIFSVLAALTVVQFWVVCVLMIRKAAGRDAAVTALLAALLPLAWGLGLVLLGVGGPAVVAYVLLLLSIL